MPRYIEGWNVLSLSLCGGGWASEVAAVGGWNEETGVQWDGVSSARTWDEGLALRVVGGAG